jgi:hypothetical protein
LEVSAVSPGSVRRRRVRPNVVEDGWTVRPITTASNLPSAAKLLRDRELDAVETRGALVFRRAIFRFSWRGIKRKKGNRQYAFLLVQTFTTVKFEFKVFWGDSW